MRILVVDGSQIMAWLVSSLTPAGVEVEIAGSFSEALAILRDHPPQGAVFNITPAALPWQALAEICRSQRPPIPFLWCASVPREHLDMGERLDEPYLVKPLSAVELKKELEYLLKQAEALEPEPIADPVGAKEVRS